MRHWIYTIIEYLYSWYHIGHIDIDTITSWNWVAWIVDTRMIYEFEKYFGNGTSLVPHLG